jgi:hypothetical protein
VNKSILLKIGEFITNFHDVEVNQDSFSQNLIILTIFLEFILNLINNIEFPGTSSIILILLKFDDQFNMINSKYYAFYNTNLHLNEGWESFSSIFEKLIYLLNKFKKKIHEEGANVKFTQNNEVRLSLLNYKNY